MSNPEHHTNCPAFCAFEMGDTATTAPECKCVACEDCDGEGYFIVENIHDWKYDEPIECESCEGIGRVLR